MKHSGIRVLMHVAVMAAAIDAHAGEVFLKYDYAATTRDERLQRCERSATGTVTCETYLPKNHTFKAGDVVRLEVHRGPVLSFFAVRIDDDKVIQPVLPFIRGVSDAQPAEESGSDAGGKSLALGNVLTSVAGLLPKIQDGDEPALRKAVDDTLKALREAESNYDPAKYVDIALSLRVLIGKPVNDPRTTCGLSAGAALSAPTGSYPGPTYQDVLTFALAVEKEWAAIPNPTPATSFVTAVGRTELLLNGIREINSRLSLMASAIADRRNALNGLAAQYASVRVSALAILEAAARSPKFAQLVVNALPSPGQASQPTATVPPASGVATQASAEANALGAVGRLRSQLLPPRDMDPLQGLPAPTTNGAAIQAAKMAAEYASSRANEFSSSPTSKCVADQLGVFTALDDTVKEINVAVSRIFSVANGIYASYSGDEVHQIIVNQWTSSHTARIEILETRGFVPFSFIGTPVAGEGAGEGDQADDQAAAPAQKKAAGGKGESEGEEEGEGEEEPTKPSQKAEPKVVYRFPVEVHQISRGNFVSGFSRSRLPTREFALKDVPKLDDEGSPVVDKDGNNEMMKIPIQTREQNLQYLYYVGLNFYTVPRDLFPQATPKWAYGAPGVMFAYGVNDDANFLLGLNWELPFGLNVGVGRHWGKVKALADGYSLTEQVPASLSAVPTVDRFEHSYYLNVGFDARVFKAIFGAVNGVKTP